MGSGRGSSVEKASGRKSRRKSNVGSSLPCGKGFFSQSHLSVQTLLQCSDSPRVQSHAPTFMPTFKIQTLAAIPLFGHRILLHTLVGMGSAALAIPLFGHRILLHTLVGMGSAALAIPLFGHRILLHTLVRMGSAALAIPLFGHRILLHTLVGMGSAALAIPLFGHRILLHTRFYT